MVIYCSTLFTDEGRVNPMTRFAHGILLCCRIDEMEEGQLKKNLEELNELDASVDVICFSTKGDVPAVAGTALEKSKREAGEKPGERDEEVESVYIEKMGEIEMDEETGKGRINIPRFVTIVAAVIIATFIIWWVFTTRMIQEQESSSRMTELVQKQRDARDARDKLPVQDTTTVLEQEIVADEAAAPEQERPATEPAAALTPPAVARFTVHVASFKDLRRAEAEIGFLEKQGYDVMAVEAEIKGVAWLRIMAGRYATLEGAQQARIALLELRRITYAKVVELDAE